MFIVVIMHVQITNKLENTNDLSLHCKSTDDDLGEQVLHKDESYNVNLTFLVKHYSYVVLHRAITTLALGKLGSCLESHNFSMYFLI